IRVFINRAAASIKQGNPNFQQGKGKGIDRQAQKILRILHTPSGAAPTPTNGTPFKELGVEKDSENYFPRAFARIERLPVKTFPDGGSPNESMASTIQPASERCWNTEHSLSPATDLNIVSEKQMHSESKGATNNCEIDTQLVLALSRRIAT